MLTYVLSNVMIVVHTDRKELNREFESGTQVWGSYSIPQQKKTIR